jgi:GMP synthase (glutamine-hydrolysing)
MIALVDVLDDHPYDITAIFNDLINAHGLERLFVRINGLKTDIVIPSGVTGIVISGSVHHIYDAQKGKNWKDSLCELIKSHYTQIPILGICFGHQAIAQALGGKVAPNTLGREIGTVPIYTTSGAKQDLLFREFKCGSLVSQSHVDHVVGLPSGAVRLAHNNHSPNQAFRIGKSWGVQFHPELQPQLFRCLLSGRIKNLRQSGKLQEADELQMVSDSLQECPEAIKILKRFISFCLAESQKIKGARKDE